MKKLIALVAIFSATFTFGQYSVLGTSGEKVAKSTSISPLVRTVNDHNIEWHQDPRYSCDTPTGRFEFGEGDGWPTECGSGGTLYFEFKRDFPAFVLGDGRLTFDTSVTQPLNNVAEGVDVQLGRRGVALGNDITIPGNGGWGYLCYIRLQLKELRGKTSLHIEPSADNYWCGRGGSDAASFTEPTRPYDQPQTYCLRNRTFEWFTGHTTCDAGWSTRHMYCARYDDWTSLFDFEIVYSQGGLQVHKSVRIFPSMDVPGQQHDVNRYFPQCIDV